MEGWGCVHTHIKHTVKCFHIKYTVKCFLGSLTDKECTFYHVLSAAGLKFVQVNNILVKVERLNSMAVFPRGLPLPPTWLFSYEHQRHGPSHFIN